MLNKSRSFDNLLITKNNIKNEHSGKLKKSRSSESILKIPKSLPFEKKVLFVQRRFNKQLKSNKELYSLFCLVQDLSCGYQYSADIHTNSPLGLVELFTYLWFSDKELINQRIGILVLINLLFWYKNFS